MIEIVFNDSACGSLKTAQHFGEGSYSGGCTAFFLSSDDGQPTEEELRQAQEEFEARERASWEKATPMGGNPADVYGFALYLSIGDISEEKPAEKRQNVLHDLFDIFPDTDDTEPVDLSLMQQAKNSLQEVLSHSAAGEPIRTWYSNQPDEACGLCWFMAQLEALEQPYGDVFLVKLPETRQTEQGILRYTGCGELAPEEWMQYVPLQQQASPVFCQACAQKWHTLQRENAPLRAVLNGQLVSVPETIYDSFIRQVIAEQEDIFHEAMVIGTILGRYQLGIGDAWIASRIEQMISDGLLEPVSQPAKDSPVYHRLLRKIK